MALLLSIIMLLGVLPVSSLAEEVRPDASNSAVVSGDSSAVPSAEPTPVPADAELLPGERAEGVLTYGKAAAYTIRLTIAKSEAYRLLVEGGVCIDFRNEQDGETETFEAVRDADGAWMPQAIELALTKGTYYLTLTAVEPLKAGEECAFAVSCEEAVLPTASPEPVAVPRKLAASRPAQPVYVFEKDTVSIGEILDALDLELKQNGNYFVDVEVDSDVIRLSGTKGKAKVVVGFTLTASRYFETATLTLKNGNQRTVIALSYPEPDWDDPKETEGMTIAPTESLSLSGTLPQRAVVDIEPAAPVIEGETLVAAYDISIYANEKKRQDGETWQPETGKVTVRLCDESFGNRALDVYHIPDGGAPVYVATVQAEDGWVSFEADGFSVYGFTETRLRTTISTSDGTTYEIEVTYPNNAGIPMHGTALSVREILPDSEAYQYYLDESAKAIGTDAFSLALSRPFDIRIVDEKDPDVVYEPQASVNVSIRVIGETLSDYVDVHVLHFAEDAEQGVTVEKMDATVSEDAVSFATDSFSVYTLSGEVYTVEIRFLHLDEYMYYVPYYVNNGTENPTYTQAVRTGDRIVAPQNPINPQDPEAAFAGWYRSDDGGSTFYPTPYDFSKPVVVTQEENGGYIELYARYTHYAYVIFHDQYEKESNSFPIAFTRRVDLESDDLTVDLREYSVSYRDPGTNPQEPLDNNKMVFVGWSDTPITEPGAAMNDYGDHVEEVHQTNGRLLVTATIHLYPIYKPVKWLSFYSGPSGSHATYFTDTYYLEGVGPKSLPGTAATEASDTTDAWPAMTRDGHYAFKGWYVNATVSDSTGELVLNTDGTPTGATRIADETGKLDSGVTAGGVKVVTEKDENGTELYRYLQINDKMPTLYACWEQVTNAPIPSSSCAKRRCRRRRARATTSLPRSLLFPARSATRSRWIRSI